jgi:hypothetical protein
MDHVHAVSTRAYECDQSSRQLPGCHRRCCRKRPLKAHQRERVPPAPPIDVVQVPERCSRARVRCAAPHNGAPLPAPRRSGRSCFAMGGSGGNTRTFSDYSKRRIYSKPITQHSTGLDKVAPYQFSDAAECTTPNPSVREFGEPSLDQIQP